MDLPHNIFLYVLLVGALAIGFLLGRREKRPREDAQIMQDYYQGLNFLLGERPELGVDRFIQVMAVADDSVDVHLALAGVVRRRGEVDKAIRIHQNLLASPALNQANKQLVEFELARDYMAAGLLDRAEGLLADIVARRDAQYDQAVGLLVDVYEQEKDWSQAIDVLQKYRPDGRAASPAQQALFSRLSHFHCERSEQFLARHALKDALASARAAAKSDPQNPRTYMVLAKIDAAQKRHKSVMKNLTRAVELDRHLALHAVEMFERSALAVGAERTFLEFLEARLQEQPHAKLLRRWMTFTRQRGMALDVERVLGYIERAPTVQHAGILLELLPQAPDHEGDIQRLLVQVTGGVEAVQCSNCGFSGHHHLWHCPTCKRWGTFVATQEIAAK